MATTQDQIKAYAAPGLIVVCLTLIGLVWANLNTSVNNIEGAISTDVGRISLLENGRSATDATLGAIQTSMGQSVADRKDFQAATTARLDKMADTLTSVGESLAALTAIQQQEAQKAAASRLPEVLKD